MSVCVCTDVHVSWKVEKTTYPIVERHQPVAPILGLWYYVTMWVFPNMWFVLEKLYESSTVVFNLFFNPRGLLRFCSMVFVTLFHMLNFGYNVSVSHSMSSLLTSGGQLLATCYWCLIYWVYSFLSKSSLSNRMNCFINCLHSFSWLYCISIYVHPFHYLRYVVDCLSVLKMCCVIGAMAELNQDCLTTASAKTPSIILPEMLNFSSHNEHFLGAQQALCDKVRSRSTVILTYSRSQQFTQLSENLEL